MTRTEPARSGASAGNWQSLRRGFRRLQRSLGGPRARFFYSPQYSLDIPGVLQDPVRSERVLTWLSLEGLLRRRDVMPPAPASISALRRAHSDAYLDDILAPGALVPVVGYDPGDPLQERILALQRRMAGGTIAASRTALASGGVAVNLGGGFHHAHRDRGQGFCAYNDIAIAILELRARGFAGRVVVVDLDLHDGDGTRAIFAADPTVFTFSIHNYAWGAPEAVASFSLALGGGVDNATYLGAVREHLPRVFAEFAPELVIYVAGVDPAEDDRLGDWKITGAGLLERDRTVLGLARGASRSLPLPLVAVMAGGYGPDAWRHAARFYSLLLAGGGLGSRQALEPASTADIVMYRYREMSRLLSAADLSGGGPGERLGGGGDWDLRAEDIFADLGGVPHETRFLGFYTLQGLELAIERAGLFDRLRAIGFTDLNLELDLSNQLGQTLRLYGDAARQEVLLELRARRDRSTLPGMELLAIEWLLLQNPRASFTVERPPLPGQKHPGLGMSQDVLALLLVACERLKLDGVVFVPSRYHIVGTVRGPLRFLEPEDEARREAIREALHDLPLVEAARLLENDQIVDVSTGEPMRWKPAAMVMPVSPRLKALIESDEYAARRAKARAALRLERH